MVSHLSVWMASVLIVLLAAGAQAAATFRNPLDVSTGSDPWLLTYNGNYYLTTTTWSDIRIKKAATIKGLIDAELVQVWRDSTPERCWNVWAPEFRRLAGPNGTRW